MFKKMIDVGKLEDWQFRLHEELDEMYGEDGEFEPGWSTAERQHYETTRFVIEFLDELIEEAETVRVD